MDFAFVGRQVALYDPVFAGQDDIGDRRVRAIAPRAGRKAHPDVRSPASGDLPEREALRGWAKGPPPGGSQTGALGPEVLVERLASRSVDSVARTPILLELCGTDPEGQSIQVGEQLPGLLCRGRALGRPLQQDVVEASHFPEEAQRVR